MSNAMSKTDAEGRRWVELMREWIEQHGATPTGVLYLNDQMRAYRWRPREDNVKDQKHAKDPVWGYLRPRYARKLQEMGLTSKPEVLVKLWDVYVEIGIGSKGFKEICAWLEDDA